MHSDIHVLIRDSASEVLLKKKLHESHDHSDNAIWVVAATKKTNIDFWLPWREVSLMGGVRAPHKWPSKSTTNAFYMYERPSKS